jgi:predicted permease
MNENPEPMKDEGSLHPSAFRLHPSFSWLDVKLGLRMIPRHPGVSLVIVFSLALGIPVSLLPHHLLDAATGQSPPFHDGERVVGIMGAGKEGPQHLRLGDYEQLRTRLTTFASLGAAIPGNKVNVITKDGQPGSARGALITASSFTLARVPPMMGRALSAADEVEGAQDVAVVGHEFWRTRLGAADDVVGTTLRIGGIPTTIVGVMPEEFALPSAEEFWLPLRVRSIDYGNGLGPAVWVYGRLADGVGLSTARAEVSVVGLQTVPRVRPDSTRAQAVAFSTLEFGEPQGVLMQMFLLIAQVVPLIFLLMACGNAGILLLARTATRSGEFALRTALGASRARIVGQLFVEALLLALLATGVGLFVIDVILARVEPHLPLPFWLDLGLTPMFVLKALGLSVLSAVVAGVLPALRVTGSGLHRTLQSAGLGGSTVRFGRVAGALIVAEVGVAVAALFAGGMIWHLFQPVIDEDARIAERGRYLVASIAIPRSELGAPRPRDEALRIRLANLQTDIGRRLTSQPAVRRWSFSDQPPGEETGERLASIDGDGSPPGHLGLVSVSTFVDPEFFAVLDISPLQGRLFRAEDVSLDPAVEPTAVIVNKRFLDRRGMHPESAIGARMRFTVGGSDRGPWMEIVGVVPNIEATEDRVMADGTPVVYIPATPGTLDPMTLLIDLRTSPSAFASQLRLLVAEADPTALVDDVYALEGMPDEGSLPFRVAIGVMTGLSLLGILLSTTALYALMSMTVAQRTREIGIRLALGGTPRNVVMTVARRALVQIAVGVALGAGIWVPLVLWAMGDDSGGGLAQVFAVWPYVLGGAVGVVLAMGLTASLAPTLRAVRMPPVDALRVDG